MTVMVQVSVKDTSGNLYNVKSESDEPDVTWADLGSILTSIGGDAVARNVKAVLAGLLGAGAVTVQATPDALQQAENVVRGVFPQAQVVGQSGPPLPAAAAQPQQSQAPMCAHGPRRWYEHPQGEYKAWFCSAPRETPREQKCKAQYVR